MNITGKISNGGIVRQLLAGLGLVLLVVWAASAADLKLPELKTSKGNFTNVVVTSKTKTDIMILHDRGFGNVKISDIEDDAALIALGLREAADGKQRPGGPSAGSAALARILGTNSPLQTLIKSPAWSQMEKELGKVQLSLEWQLGIAVGSFALFLFFSNCLKLISEKVGQSPGFLVWLPVLQMIPALRAAGMSGWWLLACFVPLLNLVAAIIWSFKIARVRGKSAWVAIGLLLPVTNIFSFLYLAYSGVKSPEGKITFGR